MKHRIVTDTVHNEASDVKICLQILHSGPLARSSAPVAPSAVRSPISRVTPIELDEVEIEKQISDHLSCAKLAKLGGYDGVEVIGSAGYLISTFLVEKANLRTDKWGGPYENRIRFAIEIIRRIRESVGSDLILIFRIAAMDMLQGGMSWDEVVTLANEIEHAGASVVSIHFTWH